MRVVFEDSISGPGIFFKPNQVGTVDDADGCRLIERGIATAADTAADATYAAYVKAQKEAATKAARVARPPGLIKSALNLIVPGRM